jgi:hypothetical protein
LVATTSSARFLSASFKALVLAESLPSNVFTRLSALAKETARLSKTVKINTNMWQQEKNSRKDCQIIYPLIHQQPSEIQGIPCQGLETFA